MATFTVTCTQLTGTAAGMAMRVFVLTQASASQPGAVGGNQFLNTTAFSQSLTTTQTGSRVYGASAFFPQASATAIAATTVVDSIADNTNNGEYVTFKATALTGTPGATTLGFTSGATATGPWVECEILTAGTLTEDASGPAVVSTLTLTAVTTASFTPPAGSLLVALVAADGGTGVETVSLTDTSGLGLTWVERVKNNPTDGDYAGVWTAQLPGGGGIIPPQPGPRSWTARFKPPQTPYPPNPPALPPPQSPQLPQPGAPSWRQRFRRAQVPQWQPASALAAVVTPAPVQLPPVSRRALARAVWRGGPVPGIQGIAPRQAPYLPPRRTPARAYWRGSAPFTGFVSVPAPHQPPYLPPRRVPARAAWKGSAPFTGFVSVPAPKQPPATVFRRVLARAYWRGGPVPPIVSVPPRQLITIPRRKPSRAYVQFTPVATVNAAPVVPTSGTTQPWPTVPVPRRMPLRAIWRGLAVPPQTGQAPRQVPPIARRAPARALWRGSAPFTGFVAVPAPAQVPPLPRRKPARAVVQFTPVATVNATAVAVAAPRQLPVFPRRKPARAYVQFRAVATVNAPFVPRGLPPQGPDDKGYLKKLLYLTG